MSISSLIGQTINRILIVGQGSIGKRHLRLATGFFPEADIRVLNRHEAMGDFVPQIAVIANPAPFHVAMAIELAKWGTHLLVEKPLAASSEGVQELMEICRENKSVLLVGYNLRFLHSLIKFKECIQRDLVGVIFSVRSEVGQYLPSWRPNVDYTKSVSAQSNLGGGVLFELSHEIDYLYWLFGKIDWVSAVICKQSRLAIDVEDTAHMVLGFKKQLVVRLDMDFIRHDKTRQCTVIGEKGSLRWDALRGSVEFYKSFGKRWETLFCCAPHPDESYIGEWENLIACIQGKVEPIVSGEDGLAVLKVIDAAWRSVRCNSRVYL